MRLSPTPPPASGGDLTHHRATLVRFARRLTHTIEDAEDVVQTAYLIAARRPDVSGPTAIGWLKTVVRNEAWRMRARAQTPVVVDAIDLLGGESIAPLLTAPPVDLDLWLDVRAALAACKEHERRALVGRAAGLSYAELAERNAWTYTKVNRCLSEGRARVRELVEP
jgi:RNA polymerase sigma factor (sigma-70 family)